MKKLNNKGISIVEVLVTFSIIMVIVISMLSIVMNYRSKVNITYEKLELDTFKNTLTKDIQDDILEYGIKEINTAGECNSRTDLSRCINIVFKDDTERIFGVSKINKDNKQNEYDSVLNKYLYYDDLKYPIKEDLPNIVNIPETRSVEEFQTTQIISDSILSVDSIILEDSKVVNIYKIDIYISHIDFEEDFGIHIVATTEDSLNKTLIPSRSNFTETTLPIAYNKEYWINGTMGTADACVRDKLADESNDGSCSDHVYLRIDCYSCVTNEGSEQQGWRNYLKCGLSGNWSPANVSGDTDPGSPCSIKKYKTAYKCPEGFLPEGDVDQDTMCYKQ